MHAVVPVRQAGFRADPIYIPSGCRFRRSVRDLSPFSEMLSRAIGASPGGNAAGAVPQPGRLAVRPQKLAKMVLAVADQEAQLGLATDESYAIKVGI